MSAITTTVTDNKITVLTDAAIYDPGDGTLVALTPKVFPVPGLEKAVFSSRGHAGAPLHFAEAVGSHQFQNWRDFQVRLDEIWQVCEASMGKIGIEAEFVIAGWDDTARCGRVFSRFNIQDKSFKLSPSVTYFMGPGHACWGPKKELMGDPATFDPSVDGVRAFEAARRAVNDLNCGRGPGPAIWAHSVGGWIDAAEITPLGLTWRRIHTWPGDVVGQKIMGPRSPYVTAFEACLEVMG